MRRRIEHNLNQEKIATHETRKPEITFDVRASELSTLDRVIDKLKAVNEIDETKRVRSPRLETRRRNEREQKIHDFERKDPERAYAMKLHDVTVQVNNRKDALKKYRTIFPNSRDALKKTTELENRSQSFLGTWLKRISPKLYDGYVGKELDEKRQEQLLASALESEIASLQDRYKELSQMHQFEKRKKEILAKEANEKKRVREKLGVLREHKVETNPIIDIRSRRINPSKIQHDKAAV